MTQGNRPGLFSVELRSAQWELLVAWYRNVLGLRVLVRVVEDGYALFEAGDTRLAILLRDTPGNASGRWSLGFEVNDLSPQLTRLREHASTSRWPQRASRGIP
jgi:Glyoxalase/Bleomycin resistance protein/Dioxygenase superfamily.